MISDISTKSKSKIFLTSLVGRRAAGLYGPLLCSPGPGLGMVRWGCVTSVLHPVNLDEATEARRLSPEELPAAGVNIGSDGGRGGVADVLAPVV